MFHLVPFPEPHVVIIDHPLHNGSLSRLLAGAALQGLALWWGKAKTFFAKVLQALHEVHSTFLPGKFMSVIAVTL